MKLYYYKGATPNFGDDLNPWMWSRLTPPSFFDDDDSELFVGIGSILDARLPKSAKKYIFGSGYGGYNELVDVKGENWDIRFVRGPDTAKAVGAPEGSAVSDSAILLRAIECLPEPAKAVGIALVPHFRSLRNGDWFDLARRAGFTLVDPRSDVEKVLSQIAGADLVVTEAMHGAIVSDALRTPWLALEPKDVKHRMKWKDWSSSLEIDLQAHKMPSLSLIDWYIGKTEGQKYYEGKARAIQNSVLAKPVNYLFRIHAASGLKRLVKTQKPQLSEDGIIAERTQRALEIVKTFIEERCGKSIT